jgi:hypothetical protein
LLTVRPTNFSGHLYQQLVRDEVKVRKSVGEGPLVIRARTLLTTEHDHLALALRHILRGEEMIREQRDLVDRLAQRGYDTELAQSILDTMQTSLRHMHERRHMMERASAAGRI